MNIQSLSPLCTEKHKAYQICINRKCKAPSFICANHRIDQQEGCPCQIPHMECEKINWNSIKNKLDKSAIREQPQFKQFLQKMENEFVQAKARIDQTKIQYNEWKQSFGLTDKQSQFVKMIREGRTKQVTGMIVFELRKQLKLSPEIVIMSENEMTQRLNVIQERKERLIEEMSALYNKVTVVKSCNIESPEVSEIEEILQVRTQITVKSNVSQYHHMNDNEMKIQLDKINENLEILSGNTRKAIATSESGISKMDKLSETLYGQLQNLELYVNSLEEKLFNIDIYSRNCNEKSDKVLNKIILLETVCNENQIKIVNKIDGIEVNYVNNNQLLNERIYQIENSNNSRHNELMQKMNHMETHYEQNKQQLLSDVRQRISQVNDHLGNRMSQQSLHLVQRMQQIERIYEEQKQQILLQMDVKINQIKTNIINNFKSLSTAQDQKKTDIINSINNVKSDFGSKINTLRTDLAREIKETDVRVIRGVQEVVKKQAREVKETDVRVIKGVQEEVKKQINQKEEKYIIQPKPITIKQKYLSNLYTKVQQLQGKPTNLELKWFYGHSKGESIEKYITHFGNTLRNNKFRDLQYLTLYYPWTLGNGADRIKAQKTICDTLMNIPKFKQLKIITSELKQKDAFVSLGNRVTVIVQENWYNKESW